MSRPALGERLLGLSFSVCAAGLECPLTMGRRSPRNRVPHHGGHWVLRRHCCVFLMCDKLGSSAQAPGTLPPAWSQQTPACRSPPRERAAIRPRALPQAKSPTHVTIGSGLMKLSTDGYFVVVL